jgi:transcriptional regulator with XRE-family HTH domain
MSAVDLSRAFGATVRELRVAKGISQEELASAAGIDRAYMGGIERGQRNPTLMMIERVAIGLGTPISEIFRTLELKQRRKH